MGLGFESQPNHEQSKSRNRRLCDFCDTATRRKLAFVSDAVSQKTASAPAECRFASVSMMARGGREKASQRLNPESRRCHSGYPGSHHIQSDNINRDVSIFRLSGHYLFFLSSIATNNLCPIRNILLELTRVTSSLFLFDQALFDCLFDDS